MSRITRKPFFSACLFGKLIKVVFSAILLSGCGSGGIMPKESLKVEIQVSSEPFRIGDTLSIALSWRAAPNSMKFGGNEIGLPFMDITDFQFSDTLTVITWPTDSLALIPEGRRSLSIISSFYSPGFYENPDPKKRRIEVSEKYDVVPVGPGTFKFEQDSDFYAVDTFAYEF